MTYNKPPDSARITFRRPRTPLGWMWLVSSVLYVLLWIVFYNSPDLKALLLSTPYIGPAVPWFAGFYLVAFIVWVIWKIYI